MSLDIVDDLNRLILVLPMVDAQRAVIQRAINEIEGLRANSVITDPVHTAAMQGYPEPQSFREGKR
jgi:hypothetical protein